ncbi:MAG: PEGA domain-containing protein [Planctomycetaceae bacterium]
MTIRTDPPEALVEVDGEQLGLSPVSMDFTYYGTREIKISKPGYETLTIQQPVDRPLHQSVPFDFVSNHFAGTHVTDRHDYVYRLREKQIPLDQESDLINRGQNFRSQAQIGRL